MQDLGDPKAWLKGDFGSDPKSDHGCGPKGLAVAVCGAAVVASKFLKKLGFRGKKQTFRRQ